MDSFFDRIIVPQGSEYQAICRGLKPLKSASVPQVLAIPMGVNAVKSYLKARDWQPEARRNILVMGLCGSLSPQYQVGDVVLYRDCLFSLSSSLQPRYTDARLTDSIYNRLQGKTTIVTGLTSDRLICSAREKLDLGRRYQASVVDMEGFILLNSLRQHNIRVAMLRVVSDSTDYDIPNLTRAIDSTGKLQNIPMAIAMLRQPLAATRLITGALKSLKILQHITTDLFSFNSR
ncbi:MAG: phosphorylase [Xenococcaceae cyanobacterium MO_188.B32]|nr:phosphorylase [Xenococcaceae cyanobacterium MO_188.B32]